jgi:hypothetical protein
MQATWIHEVHSSRLLGCHMDDSKWTKHHTNLVAWQTWSYWMSPPEDEGSVFPRNMGTYLQELTALQPRRQHNWRLHLRDNLKYQPLLNIINIYLSIMYQWYVAGSWPKLYILINLLCTLRNSEYRFSLQSTHRTGDSLRVRMDGKNEHGENRHRRTRGN